ncbi:MAG: mechanosensitive ion channel family protein [Sarcina sp.]
MQHIEIFFNNLFKLSIIDILLATGILIVFILINKIVIDRLFKIILVLTSKTSSKIDDNLVNAMHKPFKFFFIGIGGYIALKSIDIDLMPSEMLSSLKYLKILVIITVCMFIYNLTLERIEFHKNKDNSITERKASFPFIAIIIRVIIILFAVIVIANEFGLTGFLTGLGISGVVVAFAAQDTCSNLFGGMMIVLDKPFALGDWIKTDNVEGIVEEITFRSTRIRTFCKSLVTVPNGKLINNNISNYSKRDVWRITFKLILDMETKAKKIEEVLEGIELIIKSKEDVKKDFVIVKFSEITCNGYVIFIYFYTKLVSFYEYEDLKESINLAIVALLNKKDVSISSLSFDIK